MLAARKNHRIVAMNELEEAKDKVMDGRGAPFNASATYDEEANGYHEAGHALATVRSPASI